MSAASSVSDNHGAKKGKVHKMESYSQMIAREKREETESQAKSQ